MTDNDLAAIEPAARTLCQLRGLNPEEPIAAPHPSGLMIEHTVPMWHLAAEEMVAVMQILTALNTQRRAEQSDAPPAAAH